MIKEIRLREEAEEDLNEAAIWYQQQQTGLGNDFLDEVLTLSQSIKEHPLTYPIVHRSSAVRGQFSHLTFRMFNVRTDPFHFQLSHLILVRCWYCNRRSQ